MKSLYVKSVIIAGLIAMLLSTSCLNGEVIDTFTAENERIQMMDYLKELRKGGFKVDSTAMGVYYVVREEGIGAFPKKGDTLSVKYAGYLINGQMFDASFRHSADSTFHFVLREPSMIPGWDNMMEHMNTGMLTEFIVPSNLAYGSQGSYPGIPPYSSLIFVASLDSIRPKNP